MPEHRPSAENTFWETIEPFGWGTTTDYQAIKIALMRQLTPEQAEGLHARLHLLMGALERKLRDEHIEIELGDDSFGDLLAHVVGMGRQVYQQALLDPKTVQARGHRGDFSESFAYALPQMHDYEYLKLDHYLTEAERMKELYGGARADKVYTPVHPQLDLVLAALNCLSRSMVAETLAHEKEVRKAADAVAAFFKEMASKFGALGIDGSTVGNPHGIHNLFHDLRTYYLAFPPAPPATSAASSDWVGASVSVVGGDFDGARGKIT